MSYIRTMKSDIRYWHIWADCILLDTKNSHGLAMHAMIDVNRATEFAHVSTNLVHKVHRVNKYGSLQLEDFKKMLTAAKYRSCKNRRIPYPWHPLTADVFIRFLHREEVNDASDLAARNYKKNIKPEK